jgi:hypothetical protein
MNRISKIDGAIRGLSYLCLVAGLALLGYSYLSERDSGEHIPTELKTVGLSSDVRRALDLDSSHALGQIPIERIQVGMRVPARNPEITNDERSGWVEPEWDRWVKLSLDMPKPDGSVLRMELLRSEDWVFSQVGFVVAEKMGNSNDESGRDEAASKDSRSETLARQMSILSFEAAVELGRQIYGDDFQTEQISLSPLRPIFRELASTSSIVQHAGDTLGYELLGLAVQMDLPELGLTGEAIVESIEPFSAVSAGPGQVVTATFHHGSADTIDLSIAGDSRETGNVETIGTTSNHPFWSQDRQGFIEAGSLEMGERLITHHGETKRVVNKLPRPGPEPVFNIEVWGEQVYYAGRSAALVHNTYPNDPRGTQPAADGLYADVLGAFRRAGHNVDDLAPIRFVDQELDDAFATFSAGVGYGPQITVGRQFFRESLEMQRLHLAHEVAHGLQFRKIVSALGDDAARIQNQRVGGRFLNFHDSTFDLRFNPLYSLREVQAETLAQQVIGQQFGLSSAARLRSNGYISQNQQNYLDILAGLWD